MSGGGPHASQTAENCERIEETPVQITYELRGDTSYAMEADKTRIAIIFQTVVSSDANDDAAKLEHWLNKLEFLVIKPDLQGFEKRENVTQCLTNLMKHVSFDAKIDGSKNCCIFFAFLCKANVLKQTEQIWHWLTVQKSRCTTRPKIFLLQEYPEKWSASSDGGAGVAQGTRPILYTLKPHRQSSHVNFIFIHGSGPEYISTFTDVALNNRDLEINELILRVNATMAEKNSATMSEKNSVCCSIPYYSSTLIYELYLKIKKGSGYGDPEEKEATRRHLLNILERGKWVAAERADKTIEDEELRQLKADLKHHLSALSLLNCDTIIRDAEKKRVSIVKPAIHKLLRRIKGELESLHGGIQNVEDLRTEEDMVKDKILTISDIVVTRTSDWTHVHKIWVAIKQKVELHFERLVLSRN